MRDRRPPLKQLSISLAFALVTSSGAAPAQDYGLAVDIADGAHDFYQDIELHGSPRFINEQWDSTSEAKPIARSNVDRLRAELVPAFLSFKVKSPTLSGISGSAGVSFPARQSDDCPANCGTEPPVQSWAMASADARDVFFDIGGRDAISVGRTLNLFQRRYAFTSRDIPGSGAAFGRTPRFEAEASYAANIAGGAVNFWLKGMYQETQLQAGDDLTASTALIGRDVTASGVHLGTHARFGGLQLAFSYFEGEALGNTFLHETDSLDSAGNERDNAGFIAQGIYTFGQSTRVGISFGESKANKTSAEKSCRSASTVMARCAQSIPGSNGSYLQGQSAWSVGVYHDVTAWLKIVAEYTNYETDWYGAKDQEVDTFALGGYFFW